ncbi:MAG: hypothetical protein CBC12_03295 [Candidatus Puniceispirillum sp. TMED52]|nr:hypothetical protein [SAR116 cluster bacterium]OUU52806.1 MAG: hypothetical protein CBC12_03295 [Candidatus Puniceispirillum sp. TMED52]
MTRNEAVKHGRQSKPPRFIIYHYNGADHWRHGHSRRIENVLMARIASPRDFGFIATNPFFRVMPSYLPKENKHNLVIKAAKD